ncbi:PAS domain S-box protein, putative (macronuclear) [Tetrahymena thermophila SB210]|uniref:PAS domain S-box protein, putative n=1 Tax=Tetrahymena thermophila (strain SB210) TaxID=312017 RepID=Q23R41_TETTS|nr:PAS domain S-box protein, putative [Tetrahymena thermophila SB210]EAR99000.1 PAS domain S-box protein, putative [Tetrahymena thermophila SB210]|eukprot:XP_001019245.1 PAS domain S-box protein, putative [Tetrahymena thermophila SB210]
MNEILNQAVNSFDENVIVFDRNSDHTVNQLKTNQNTIIDQSAQKNSVELIDLFIGITFDERLNEIEQDYYHLINDKIDVVQLLCNDTIDITHFKIKANLFSQKRNKFLTQLQELSKINRLNSKIQLMQEGYINYFSFGEKKKQLFKKVKAYQNNQSDSNQINKQETEIQSSNISVIKRKKIKLEQGIFERKNCVIFVSLLGEPGIVKRVQHQFENIFGYSTKQIIGQNINLIIPNMIKKFHNSILLDFINNPYLEKGNQIDYGSQINQENQNFDNQYQIYDLRQLLLAKDLNGWAIPVKIAMKTDVIGFEDCGITSYIQQIKDDCSYILSNCGYFKCELMSQKLYERMFTQYITTSEISHIYFNRVIPILHYLEKEWLKLSSSNTNPDSFIHPNQRDFFSTIAFLPKINTSLVKKRQYKFTQKLEYDNLQDEIDKYSIEHYDIYQVKLRLFLNRNKYFQYNIIQVSQIRKLMHPFEMKENLINFANQMQLFLGIKYNTHRDIHNIQLLLDLQQFDATSQLQNSFFEIPQTIQEDNEQISDRKKDYSYIFHSKSTQKTFENGEKQILDQTSEMKQKTVFNQDKFDETHHQLQMTGRNVQDIDNNYSQQNLVHLSSRNDLNTIVNGLDATQNQILDQNQSSRYLFSKNILQEERELQQPIQGQIGSLQQMLTQNHLLLQNEGEDDYKKNTKNIKVIDDMTTVQEKSESKQLNSIYQSSHNQKNVGSFSKNFTTQNSFNSKNLELTQFYNSQKTQNSKRKGYKKLFSKGQTEIQNQLQNFKEYGFSKPDFKMLKYQNKGDDYLNQAQSFTVSNEREKKLRKEQEEKSKALEASSIKSSQSYNHDFKKQIRKKVLQRSQNFNLKILNIFGYISLFCISIITIYEYLNSIYSFQIVEQTFHYVSWPMSFRSSYSISAAYIAMIYMTENKIFNSLNEASGYEKIVEGRLNQTTVRLKKVFLTYEDSNFNEINFFKRVNEELTYFTLTKDIYVQTGNIYDYQPQYKINITMTLAYFLQNSIANIYRFSLRKNNLVEQIIRIDNFPTLNANVTTVDQNIHDETNDVLNSMNSQALLLMLIVILVSFTLIIMIFPLYYTIQKKNEQILKLFATMHQNSLDAVLQPLYISILMQNKRQSQNLTMKPHIQKKKNISTTNSLPKYKISYIIFTMIAFICLIVQPIVNLILINNFQDQNLQNLALLSNLYDMRAQLISNTAQNYNYLTHRLDTNYQLYNPNYYKNRIAQLITQNQGKLNNMYSVLNSQTNIVRFQQSKFNSFFNQIFYGNVCEALQNNPDYVSQENNVNYNECINIGNGRFKQGFIIVLKNFLSTIEDLSYIYKIQDKNLFKEAAYKWENTVNIKIFDDTFVVLAKSMDSFKDFMLTMISEYVDYVKMILTALLIFQFCMLILIFYFGWVKFYQLTSQDMHQVKSLFSIFPIDIVLDNPYIISFLNK